MEKKLPIIGEHPFVCADSVDKYLRVHGRYTIKQNCLAFDWPNSGISFNFTGTGFILSFGSYSADQPVYIKVFLDGVEQRFAISTGQEKVIYENLPNRRHRVTVLRVTEGATPLLFKDLYLLGREHKMMAPPFEKPRKIEFLGDSITAGYGVIANPTEPIYNTYQQDSTMTYAYFTAKEFDADARYICVSGQGVIYNCNGERDYEIPLFFQDASRQKEKWDFSSWQPDIVVINAGTNDAASAVADKAFTEAAIQFIGDIREKYANASIIWVYGMMNSKYVSAIKEAVRLVNQTDDKVHFLYVDSITTNPGETGANGHPNTRGHMRVSKLLNKKIKSVTAWQ